MLVLQLLASSTDLVHINNVVIGKFVNEIEVDKAAPEMHLASQVDDFYKHYKHV